MNSTANNVYSKLKFGKKEYSGASERTSLLNDHDQKTSIYAFANSNLTNDEINTVEITQLRSRGSNNRLTYNINQETKGLEDNTVYLTRDVDPNDTLQSFSLLYGCSVSDLKRANGFIQDQDLYAVRTIKIPVKKHGLLTNHEEFIKRSSSTSLSSSSNVQENYSSVLPKEHVEILKPLIFSNPNETSNISGTRDSTFNPADIDSGDSIESLNLLGSTPSKTVAMEKNDVTGYLKKLDKDIMKTVRKTDKNSSNTVLDEVVSSMSSVAYQPLQHNRGKRNSNLDGADCGMKWWSVLLVFLIVIILFVIFAVFEFKQTQIVNDNNTSAHPGH